MPNKSTPVKKNNVSNPSNGSTATSLQHLFEDGLKDIYWAESALIKALPKLLDKASDNKLKTAIKEHLDQTKDHVMRIESIFELIGQKPVAEKCEAMEGILKEGDSTVQKAMEGPVRDAAIISSSQRVEHYEIAAYGTLAAYAKTLNHREALDLLLLTLGEEKKSDCLLSTIADTNLNSQAMAGEFKPKKIKAV